MSIRGLGIAQPLQSIEQDRAAEIAAAFVYGDEKQKRAVPTLFRRTRVRRRGSVLLESGNGHGPEQSFYLPAASLADRGPTTALRMQRYAAESVPLAVAAARRACEAANTSPQQITHLVNVSCTGFFAPGIDVALIKQLGLPPTIGRVQVGFMGCHGVLNGLRLIRAFIEADPTAHVLLCAVELCSLHYQYGATPDQLVANALFADGAAALVAAAAEGTDDPWQIAATASVLLPDCEEAMTWRIGDHGFEMTLSARVPEVIAAACAAVAGGLAQGGRALRWPRSALGRSIPADRGFSRALPPPWTCRPARRLPLPRYWPSAAICRRPVFSSCWIGSSRPTLRDHA